MGARDKARADREAGDLGSARRRLMSLHDSRGYDPKLCREIGMLSIEMRDLVEAGRWLLMSDLEPGSPLDAAIEAFLASRRHDRVAVLGALPRAFKSAVIEDLPRPVRARLNAVGVERLRGPTEGQPRRAHSRLGDLVCQLGCSVFAFGLVVCTLIGLGTVFGWIFR